MSAGGDISGIRNFRGAVSLGDYDVPNIQKYQGRVIKVAKQVLGELHEPTHVSSDPEKEITDLSKLISSLEKADHKLEEASQTRVFRQALLELKAAREQLRSSHPQAKAQASRPQESSKSQTLQRIRELKKNVFEQVKQLPATLKTPEGRQRLFAIKEDIRVLKDLGETNLDDLEKVIACLIDPEQLRVSREEELWVARLAANRSLSPEVRDNYKSETEAVSLEKAQEAILKSFESSGTLEEIAQKSKVAMVGISERAVVFRLRRFAKIHQFSIQEGVLLNAPQVIKALKTYKNDVSKKLEEAREGVLKKLYQMVHEKRPDVTWEAFQNFLGIYPTPNMATIIPEIMQESQEEMMQQLDVEGDDVLVHLEKQVGAQAASDLESFNTFAQGIYSRQVWLIRNFQNNHILKPYAQSSDMHGNLNEGVCYANSAQRSALLLNKPDLSNQEIQMGSTEQTRKAQNIYLKDKLNPASNAKVLEKFGIQQDLVKAVVIKEYYEYLNKRVESLKKQIREGKQENLPKSELEELQKNLQEIQLSLEIAHSILAKKLPLVESSHLSRVIAEGLRERIAAGNHIFMVEFLGSTGAHAINLQVDPELGIYRFMDDNVGLCAYDDLTQLTESLARLVTMYYRQSVFETICFFAIYPATA